MGIVSTNQHLLSILETESSRPPIYNPEDYAISLKKWTSKPIVNSNEQNDTVQASCPEREMSLRQFSNVSDILNKLKTDLRFAYISFVQEFVADPNDGVTSLLELLRTIQANDTNQHTKATLALHRRYLLDENSCLQCLQYSLRCPETVRKLAMAPSGLFSLTACMMSSVCKSRIIALELLTKICCYSIAGHNAVSEAMSTMRLRFGEPVRFRFLVSMLNGAAPDLLLSGLRLINTLLETSPNKQIHLYIQAELEQAGFSIKTLKNTMPNKNLENEAINEEFDRWSKLYIDVDSLKNNHYNKCKEISALKEKILDLESQLRILQNEKQSRGEISTPAEDEGISSSDQDDLEENVHHQNNLNTYIYGAKNNASSTMKYQYICDTTSMDPTIDEVMKGFQNLINEVKNHHTNQNKLNPERILQTENSSFDFESISRTIVVQEENDIIPSKILPEPPKKSRNPYFSHDNIERNPFFEDESFDNSNCSCSQDCSSGSDHEFSKIDYSYETGSFSNGNPQINTKQNDSERSETFHYLQNECSKISKNPNQKKNIQSKYFDEKSCEDEKNINQQNRNYIIQNSNNFEKELGNKNSDVKHHAKISTSVNHAKAFDLASFLPNNVEINPISYYLNKSNRFPTSTDVLNFTLKRHNNAGLYSEQTQTQNSSNNFNDQGTSISTNYPGKCGGDSKEIIYKDYCGKIMDFPSGLY